MKLETQEGTPLQNTRSKSRVCLWNLDVEETNDTIIEKPKGTRKRAHVDEAATLMDYTNSNGFVVEVPVRRSPSPRLTATLKPQAASAVKPKTAKALTKVEPFKFHRQEKSQTSITQPFISMAELNMKFQTKTPPRYHTKRSNSTETSSRPVQHPTRKEEEEKEWEKARKYQFKAQLVNKKIYDHPPVDVPEKKKSMAPNKNEPLPMASISSILHGGAVPVILKKMSTQVKPFSFDARDSNAISRRKEKIQKMKRRRRPITKHNIAVNGNCNSACNKCVSIEAQSSKHNRIKVCS